jgi:hypothetical protein
VNINFTDLPWHDAELIEINIDRHVSDTIRIRVRWLEDLRYEYAILEFSDCYAFHVNMNFGVQLPDNILEANIIKTSIELDDIKSKWQPLELELTNLLCYNIVTNSTNSTINIFALTCNISSWSGPITETD